MNFLFALLIGCLSALMPLNVFRVLAKEGPEPSKKEQKFMWLVVTFSFVIGFSLALILMPKLTKGVAKDMSSKSMQRAHDVLEAQKRYERRSGYNRGIRAAAKLALDCWAVGTAHREQAEGTSREILTLLKPSIDNPGMRVKA